MQEMHKFIKKNKESQEKNNKIRKIIQSVQNLKTEMEKINNNKLMECWERKTG